MWFWYSSGRLKAAWRMLERAVTEMVTIPSKLAETWEPLRVSRRPVVLNICKPRRRRGREEAVSTGTLRATIPRGLQGGPRWDGLRVPS